MPQQEHRKNCKAASLRENEQGTEEERKSKKYREGGRERQSRKRETMTYLVINLHCQILPNRMLDVLYSSVLYKLADRKRLVFCRHNPIKIRPFGLNNSRYFRIMTRQVQRMRIRFIAK